jgi:uncharacterized protein YkwD
MRRVSRIVLLLALLAGGYWLWQQRRYTPVTDHLVKLQRDMSRDMTKRIEEIANPMPARRLPGGVSLSNPDGVKVIARFETMLCNLANQERAKHGLSQLEIDPGLAVVARSHSREMMQKGYFAHESPVAGRRNPMERYTRKYGRPPHLIAENIYMFQGPPLYLLDESDFRRAHIGWMDSPGHRKNILRASPLGGPTRIAVGIIVKDGSYWATQLFSRP